MLLHVSKLFQQKGGLGCGFYCIQVMSTKTDTTVSTNNDVMETNSGVDADVDSFSFHDVAPIHLSVYLVTLDGLSHGHSIIEETRYQHVVSHSLQK